MTMLEIEMNNAIDELILQLQAAKQSNMPQSKVNAVEKVSTHCDTFSEFWNYKLEKYRNSI